MRVLIDDVIARARAPYTHGYGDSGQAAMDAKRLADECEVLRGVLRELLLDAENMSDQVHSEFCVRCCGNCEPASLDAARALLGLESPFAS
jgi:hypothetical protein